MTMLTRCSVASALVVCVASVLAAQDDRAVLVEGRSMRVRTLGLPDAAQRPVVVFESGAGTGMSAWLDVLPDVSAFATVVAYDRAGIGGSVDDGQLPTPRHVAQTLHALLGVLGVKAPYVLVGHSWGGLLIRMFAATYPSEVAGLVYVDSTDPRSPEQNAAYLRASGYTDAGILEFMERRRQEMAAFIATRTGPYRSEMEVIQALETSGFAEFRALPPPPSVPAAILVSNRLEPQMWQGRPCQPDACREHWMRERVKALRTLAPAGAGTVVTLADMSGHEIQKDEPALVVSAIRRVVEAQPSRRRGDH
jgi:pimeloyl-ACP methyl ester carboxylesterase